MIISTVLSSVLGWVLLGGQLDIFVSIGAVGTILAIFNYVLDSSQQMTPQIESSKL